MCHPDLLGGSVVGGGGEIKLRWIDSSSTVCVRGTSAGTAKPPRRYKRHIKKLYPLVTAGDEET